MVCETGTPLMLVTRRFLTARCAFEATFSASQLLLPCSFCFCFFFVFFLILLALLSSAHLLYGQQRSGVPLEHDTDVSPPPPWGVMNATLCKGLLPLPKALTSFICSWAVGHFLCRFGPHADSMQSDDLGHCNFFFSSPFRVFCIYLLLSFSRSAAISPYVSPSLLSHSHYVLLPCLFLKLSLLLLAKWIYVANCSAWVSQCVLSFFFSPSACLSPSRCIFFVVASLMPF